jgi:hypothetical protein
LKTISERETTLSKRTFHSKGELLGTGYLKFLINKRGFCNFEIDHFFYYEERDYLSQWLDSLLQKRYELKKSKGNELKMNVLKLIINSFYGMMGIEAVHFPKTKLVRESSWSKKRRDDIEKSMNKIMRVTLVGALDESGRRCPGEGKDELPIKRRKKDCDLLYAITRKNDLAKISNCIQASAAILSQSREIFFEKIYLLLKYCDPRFMELCYTG